MSWRFIPYSRHDAASNMAIDEYLLEAHLQGKIPPTLRLYGFEPSAVTIGRNQVLDTESKNRIRDYGFDIARRPTGGRAVLHHKDITYAFIGSEIGSGQNGVLKPSVSAAYKQISAGLQSTLEIFGLRAELGESRSAYRNLSDCFLATTPADLHVDGLKLAGSAQLRRRTAVLQHGSIPLALEQSLMSELLNGAELDESNITTRHANLFELLGKPLLIDELNLAFKLGFEKAFSISLASESLQAEEILESKAFEQIFEEIIA